MLHQSKLKTFTEEKINVNKKLKFDLERAENIVGKRRKCWLLAFAEDKINVNNKLKFDLETGENIVGKGENADYQHFLLFPQCFPKPFSSGSLQFGTMC